jgi:uncharacterized RDD family membrane protein YckC
MTMYPAPPQGTPPPPTYGSGPSGPRAGFWTRFAALFIDSIIVSIVPIVFIAIAAGAHSGGLLALAYLLYFAVYVAYFVYFEGGPAGQTPGKRMLGIRIIDFNNGGPIGYGRAFVRLLGRFIAGFFCYLGYLWMLWDKEKQCWQDKMATDVVVPVQYYPVP